MRFSMRQAPRRRQRGAVAIIVGLSLAVLVGFAGLVLDLGRLFVNKTELQSAADACALAAARELICDTSTGGTCPAKFLLNAETAGIFAASQNKKDLQDSPVTIAPADVRFYTSIGPNSAYLPRGSANPNSKFAMCIARSNGLVPRFMGVVGLAEPNDVAAHAVATLAPSQNFCLGPPIGVCRKYDPVTGAAKPAPNYGYQLGEWISSDFTANGNNVDLSGNFKWVDFTPNAGGNSEIDAGLVGSGGMCNIHVGDNVDVIQPGQQQGAKDAYNTRFGIYPNGANGYTADTAPPDRTGYAYPNKSPGSPVFPIPTGSPPIGSVYNDYLRRQGNTNNTPFVQNEYGVSGPGGSIPGNAVGSDVLQTKGNNRRLVAVPMVDCNASTSSILGTVCVLMLNPMSNGATGTLYLEYRGDATSASSPCAAFGAPAGPGGLGPLVPTLVQ
jgi:Flp pilus assembly protein TadG